jgi:gamma-glutamylcyclotransferase (GGCT)/AIG2-like uncharacterized protein YtfP
LHHLSPENYPAITEGTNKVHGWCFTYKDIDLAMPFLDELEGVDSVPPDYKRIQTRLYPKNNDSLATAGVDDGPPMTWVYVFQDKARCQARTPSATFLPEGVWLPRDNEDGCLERVVMEEQTLLVIKNQPLLAMGSTVEAVRAFLDTHIELRADDLETELRVVSHFFPCSGGGSTTEELRSNEVGVFLPPHACSALQQALEQQEATAGGASPLVCVSALQAGSYARYTYRGPYYGLDRAWDDFDAAISSTASTFEAVEGAPFFQIFANYGENTLAADLRTDLYVRCKGV